MGVELVKDEQQLLEQIVLGSEKAFCTLVAQYQRPLTVFIERHVENNHIAEEIVQDIFIKIWLTREALASVRNFRNYLFVIARNHAFSSLRSQIRLRNRHAAWMNYAGNDTASTGADPFAGNMLDLIEQAIAALPEQQRKTWELVRRQGLPYRDAADQMGLSTETIKKYLQYATASVAAFVKERAAGLHEMSLAILLMENFFFQR